MISVELRAVSAEGCERNMLSNPQSHQIIHLQVWRTDVWKLDLAVIATDFLPSVIKAENTLLALPVCIIKIYCYWTNGLNTQKQLTQADKIILSEYLTFNVIKNMIKYQSLWFSGRIFTFFSQLCLIVVCTNAIFETFQLLFESNCGMKR